MRMYSGYLFLHLPSIPINYHFSKIGHYHTYLDRRKHSKWLKILLKYLDNIFKAQRTNNKDFKKLACSSFTYALLPVEYQRKIDFVLEWHFSFFNTTEVDKSIANRLICISDYNKWKATLNNWWFVDIQSGSINKLNTSIWLLEPNELQLEVCGKLNDFNVRSIDSKEKRQQLEWLKNAEHLLWMSKHKEHYIYANPFKNAYDAYINFMNMFSDFKEQTGI